ncbi:hypothetical protein OO012_00970 [Rhodobacteraceae bacterium KMM 6894]|nr:hypothetical protein [Rhodobacteraceae bacterium KMM 6894]
MPLYFTSDSIGTGIRADLGTTFEETVFVGQEATLVSTNGNHAVAGTGDGQIATIRGELYGTGVTTLELIGDNVMIDLSDTGSVTNTGTDIGNEAVSIAGDNATLHNAGTISGRVGAYIYGQEGSLVNYGTISSYATILDGSSMYAVRMRAFFANTSDEISTIENHGILSSNFLAIDADNDANGTGSTNFALSATHVTNTGHIRGDIRLGGMDDEVLNSGHIDGDIYMGADDDIYYGVNGTMEYGANIYMGSGDDAVEGGDGRERVYDGSGDDEVELGGGNDYVRAGGGADSYDGGAGRDYISYYDSSNGIRIDLRDNEISRSWGSNDTINSFESASGSKTGDDRMLGSDEANTLQSYGGDDALYGRGGHDKLRGGDGEDYFDGGHGDDLLWGGDDEDVFHFDRGEGKDIIKDFENNVDTIELDNFAFANTAAALAIATEAGGNVIFDFGEDGMLIIDNATIAQLGNDLVIV